MISDTAYYIICAVLSLMVMGGIAMMSQVKTAAQGNLLSAVSLLLGIVVTLVRNQVLGLSAFHLSIIASALVVGGVIGAILAQRVKMIQMPQLVALLNGIGGGASALVGFVAILLPSSSLYPMFEVSTALLAVAIGLITLVGSLIAAGKLHRVLPQKPMVWPYHGMITMLSIVLMLAFIVVGTFHYSGGMFAKLWILIGVTLASVLFGLFFSIRVGGADMPITISLLNSLSGVAGAIAGMATGDILLVSVGAIVGASGLLLTQIMCRAMNRSLVSILLAKSAAPKAAQPASKPAEEKAAPRPQTAEKQATPTTNQAPVEVQIAQVLREARKVIVVPGYGMALAQAQHKVKQLADTLRDGGAEVRYAIHPVAGRMPGHMNVLLAEANVDYEELFEMEAINDDFASTDAVVVIGANDVLNPAARDAEGTPIYGMPVLNVDQAAQVIICNYDLKPGYAGVENPLYSKTEGVYKLLGDAKESMDKIFTALSQKSPAVQDAPKAEANNKAQWLHEAKEVIIVPGYGMALAQAQHKVKQLADALRSRGARVRYAIHPVAGRMPGHMNVLLAEANVDYDELFEMEAINGDFAACDLAIVIGANDVLNPAARNAEGTPIYGMPVLNVDDAKNVIICNYDLKPGYAGVENPLYKKEGVALLLGDAKESMDQLMQLLTQKPQSAAPTATFEEVGADPFTAASAWVEEARNVIIVPGYGMALAQAQHLVKQLADKMRSRGAQVRYAIHPVAGRMPGHMNVLLAEASVDYDELFEMEAINDQFATCDLAIVIGANDVLNPAARDAEGTPIYGMPVLNVDQAKRVIICNYDLKPGYAGVENPLYSKAEGVQLLVGDACETLKKLL